jgi:hypothetical protein
MKIYRISILALLAICLSFHAFSQDEVKEKKISKWYNEATVELLNGSIIKGKLLSDTDDKGVQVEIIGGSVLVYPRSEVKAITMSEEKIYSVVQNYQYMREGWYYTISTTGNGTNFDGGISLNTSVGFQYSNYLAAGLGASYNQMSINQGIRTIPVFLEVRGNFLERPITPIYSMAAGYGFVLENRDFDIIRTKGGAYLHPAVGMRFDRKSGVAFTFDFGYQFQWAEITSNTWGGTNVDDIRYQRFSVRVGMIL